MVHGHSANPHTHTLRKCCLVASLVVHGRSANPPTHTLRKCHLITSVVVHSRSANPPTHTLRKCHLITSLVVHGRSTNPSTHTLRGSASSIILSIRLPTHLYVRKMWCNSFRTKLFLFLPDGNCFVSKSASFSWVLM